MATRHTRGRSTRALIAGLFALEACAGQRFGPWSRGPARATPSHQTLAIVRVRTPWYAPNFVVRSRFRDAVPEYEALAALDAKYFILTEDGRFGGIYLWSSRRDATEFYSDTWRRDIRARRGSDPDLRLFDVASVTEGEARPEGDHVGARSLAYRAHATLLLWPRAGGPTLETLSNPAMDAPGMIRSITVHDDAHVGVVSLWATRELGQTALGSARWSALGPPETRAWFEAPVLLDAGVRSRR
ncbi:MAG: hypothetical protein JNK05_41865 [Myxococcales bacterium]|nr:hypothetical protein [Myxococcales bacterium]